MSKHSKIEKIHRKIMCASAHITILSDLIADVVENEMECKTLAEIIGEKSRQISTANEKMGMIFKI